MREKRILMLGLTAALCVAVLMSGCRSPEVYQPMTPSPLVTAPSAPETMVQGDKVKVSLAVPTGDRSSSTLLVEKIAPREVRVGQPFSYDIVVTNLATCELTDVMVSDRLRGNFSFKSSDPMPMSATASEVTWKMDVIEVGGSRTIKVAGTATGTGSLSQCSKVVYRTPLCLTVVAVEPQLTLTKSAPAEVLLCDPIPVRMVVTNSGTGRAENVKIMDTLPQGLMTSDGKSQVTLDAGSLGMGESREFSMNLKAARTGKFVNKARATADGNLSAEASTTTVVRQPILTITKTAPKELFVGRQITYEITVSNKGDAAAKETVLRDAVPAGTSFSSASSGGELAEGFVTWHLGTIAPGAMKKGSLTVHANTIRTVRNTATVGAICAKPVSAEAVTKLVGIPAILLEVIDLEDPIEVGKNEKYVIVATNQGSADATDVVIECMIEDSVQFVSAEGATTGSAVDGTITFSPLAKLAPKAQATWHVTVKAKKAADSRFRVKMTSSQLTRPVDETEATNIYQ